MRADSGAGKWSGFGLLVQGTEVALKVGETLIGRGTDCDIVILGPLVSRRHARLVATTKKVTVEDLGSANGTYVNGTRVAQVSELRDGDGILVGTLELSFFVGLADPQGTPGKQVQFGGQPQSAVPRTTDVRRVATPIKPYDDASHEDLTHHARPPPTPRVSTGEYAIDREGTTGDTSRPPASTARPPIDGPTAAHSGKGSGGSGMGEVSGVVERMLRRGDLDAAVRTVTGQLRKILNAVEAGASIADDALFATATSCLKLAMFSSQEAWLDRAIEMYLAARHLMPVPLLDQLDAVRRSVPSLDSDLLHRYQEFVRSVLDTVDADELVACDRILTLKPL